MDGSDIQKFFSGTTVFVTGGTGFMGKMLIEKLLRSCPNIHRLYLLARPKKNKTVSKRLEEQFGVELYDRLRNEQTHFRNKIDVIEGDMRMIGLGISPEDRAKIVNEVEIIFHGAATVRFDEAMKSAVEINVRGTKEVCQLARECARLKSMVYISTAYSNCPLKEIKEKIYESPFPGDKLIDVVEAVDEKVINVIAPGLLDTHPNTYSYTKAIAEGIVEKYCKNLPVAIYRPSIVISTAKEPIAGWIDNMYGPTGMVCAATLGLIHTFFCDPLKVTDVIPGDMAVNACIAAAWKTGKEYIPSHDEYTPSLEISPPVYNFVSSVQQPLTFEKFLKFNEEYGLKIPTTHQFYYYFFYLTSSKFIYNLCCFFLHWIPALVIDGIAVLIGKPPMLRKLYSKINRYCQMLEYFGTKEWNFHNDNVMNLYTELCDADKLMFDFDFNHFNWSDYFYHYARSIRIYLFKDPLDTVPAGKRHQKKLKYIHYFLCLILITAFIKLFGYILSV